jgi:hypothetical protein
MVDVKQSMELSTIFHETNLIVTSLHFTCRVTCRRYDILGRCEVKSVHDQSPLRQNRIHRLKGWFYSSLLS